MYSSLNVGGHWEHKVVYRWGGGLKIVLGGLREWSINLLSGMCEEARMSTLVNGYASPGSPRDKQKT